MAISFGSIREKVLAGHRLSPEEGLFLFSPQRDLHAVGELAAAVRRRKNDEKAFYSINAHLNPTNVCTHRCPICAYSRDAGDPDAYEMTEEQIDEHVRDAVDAGCTEIHIVGGLHPGKDYAWYRGIVSQVRAAAPDVFIKAWTAEEIAHFAKLAGMSIRKTLEDLIAAGLNGMPGGGAEVFAPEIRKQIAPKKIDAETWLAIHGEAHALGLKTTATMLYGHLEKPEHRIDHLVRLRDQQDRSGGFLAFVPLQFHPEGTQFADLEPATGLTDLKVVAISRLMLDNFDHIKAYWVSLGLGTAQTALAYGADDLDGTVRRERIHHAAGAKSPQALGIEDLRDLIEEAGLVPVQRDSVYNEVA